MSSQILLHLESVEAKIRSLRPTQRLIFGASTAERSWTVYERAAAAVHRDTVAFRGIVNEFWSSSTTTECPGSGSFKAEPVSIDFLEDSGELGLVVFHVEQALFDMFSSALASGETEYVHFYSARNIELIEILEESASVSRVEFGDLLERELEAQAQDIEDLSKLSATSAQHQAARRSRGWDLYAGFWFAPSGSAEDP